MLRKNEIVTLRIEDMSDEGLGIGHTDEGVAVFVKDTVIGDSVRASITKVKKTYAFGRVAEILTPSPDRVTPCCPVARSCGGCQIQEMSYLAQLHFKENKVLGNIHAGRRGRSRQQSKVRNRDRSRYQSKVRNRSRCVRQRKTTNPGRSSGPCFTQLSAQVRPFTTATSLNIRSDGIRTANWSLDSMPGEHTPSSAEHSA